MLQSLVALIHRGRRVSVLQSVVELPSCCQRCPVYRVHFCLLFEREYGGLSAALEFVFVLYYLNQLSGYLQALVASSLLE